jgi:hypothetical protein
MDAKISFLALDLSHHPELQNLSYITTYNTLPSDNVISLAAGGENDTGRGRRGGGGWGRRLRHSNAD